MVSRKNCLFSSLVSFFVIVVIVSADQVINKWNSTPLVYPCVSEKYMDCKIATVYLWNCNVTSGVNSCNKSDFCIAFDFKRYNFSNEEPMVEVMSRDYDNSDNELYRGPALDSGLSSCHIEFAPSKSWDRHIQKIEFNPNTPRKFRYIQVNLHNARNSRSVCCFKTQLTI